MFNFWISSHFEVQCSVSISSWISFEVFQKIELEINYTPVQSFPNSWVTEAIIWHEYRKAGIIGKISCLLSDN